jgi:hypothetical protein
MIHDLESGRIANRAQYHAILLQIAKQDISVLPKMQA